MIITGVAMCVYLYEGTGALIARAREEKKEKGESESGRRCVYCGLEIIFQWRQEVSRR